MRSIHWIKKIDQQTSILDKAPPMKATGPKKDPRGDKANGPKETAIAHDKHSQQTQAWCDISPISGKKRE